MPHVLCISPPLTHRNSGPVFPRASRAYPVHGGDQAEDGTGEGHERGHDAQGEESQQLEIEDLCRGRYVCTC